jgi:hypothetical protein
MLQAGPTAGQQYRWRVASRPADQIEETEGGAAQIRRRRISDRRSEQFFLNTSVLSLCANQQFRGLAVCPVSAIAFEVCASTRVGLFFQHLQRGAEVVTSG